MPIIPQDTKQIPIESKSPAEIQNPEWFGVTGHALAQAGATGAAIGEKLNELDVALAKAKNINDFTTARREIMQSSLSVKNAFKDRTDYGNFGTDLDEIQQATTEAITSKYGSNPAVMQKLQPYIDYEFEKQRVELDATGRKLQINSMRSDLIANSDFLLKAASESPDVETANFYKTEHDRMINNYATMGIIDADDATKYKLTFNHTSNLERAKLLVLQAPDRWLKMSEDEIKGTFPSLSMTDKIQLSKSANSSLFEHKAALNNATATRVMDTLDRQYKMADGSFDFGAVNKLINDPDWRKENGVDAAIEGIIRTRYNAREADDKQIRVGAMKDALKPVDEALSKSNYTGALSVLEKIPDTVMDAAIKHQWRSAINQESRMKRAEIKADEALKIAQDNELEAAKILTKIRENEPFDEKTDLWNKVGKGGLTLETAFKLSTMLGKIQKDPNYKLGYDIIDKTLKSMPVDRANALLQFNDAFKAEADTMTGQRARVLAEEILKPKKDSKVKELMKNLWNKLPSASVNPIPTQQVRKQIGTSGGKPVYDLGNGNWEVGE